MVDHSSVTMMMGVFPTRSSFAIFCSYISLFVASGLLVTAVSKQNIYGFNKTIAILVTELLKLIICLLIQLWRSQWNLKLLCNDLKRNQQLLILYLIPAFLYCLYNNLTFINLTLFDLPTYYCLMQFRIVLTAVIYQILFNRNLNKTQWLSLMVLTFGCLIKELNVYNHVVDANNNNKTHSTRSVPKSGVSLSEYHDHSDNHLNDKQYYRHDLSTTQSSFFINFVWPMSLLLLQMFCSCFAGVYNEYLLKDSATAKGADVILQNIFMYFDSFVCNLLVYYTEPENPTGATNEQPLDLATTINAIISNPLVVLLILNNTVSGLITSLFLKSLNSILKTFAAALEVLVITLLAWVLFSVVIDIYTVCAIVLVSISIVIYSKSPVSVAPPDPDKPNAHDDGFMPLATSEEEDCDI